MKIHVQKNTSSRWESLSRRGFAILIAVCLPAFAQAAVGKGKEVAMKKSIDVSNAGTFKFTVPVGTIVIENHDKNTVELKATFKAKSKADAERIFPLLEEVSSTKGDVVEFGFRWKNKKSPKGGGLSGAHVLQVPKSLHLELRTAGGSVVMPDRGGNVNIVTSGGSIKLGEVQGELSAVSSGGSIAVDNCHGNAAIQTSGGSIKVDNVNGSLSAHTSGGSIAVGKVEGNLQAKTSGGSINASVENQISQPMDLLTSGGSINLSVNPEFKATLDAKTSGGKVICELPLEVSGKFSKTSIKGDVNGGGPTITMRSSGGHIVLSKKKG